MPETGVDIDALHVVASLYSLEVIYCPVFLSQHSSLAINSGLGHRSCVWEIFLLAKVCDFSITKSSEIKMLELFQTRANPASQKDFHWVRPGCCQVANPLKIKEEDVDRLCFIGVLGAYKPSCSVILNRAILAHRASQDNSKGLLSWKGSLPALPNKIVYQSSCLFSYTTYFFRFPYH